jgi:hypothetical protein
MRTTLGEELPFILRKEQLEKAEQPTKGQIISINDKERRSGIYILGVQGRGKSFLLASLILQDLRKGYPVIVIDPHGDLLRHIVALLPSERLSKTYLLDLTDSKHPFGLNLFSCPDSNNELERAKVVERVMHVFERNWPETKGILLEKILRYITLTFLECPGYTLADVRRLLWDDSFRTNVVNCLTNEEVKAYWQGEFSAMKPSERRKEIQALDNRLVAFLSTPFVRNIISQKQTTLDFRRAILEHEVLLIHLPMKEMKAYSTLIGTILLTHIHAATFSFGELEWDQRPGFSLFVDEFQNFSTSDFAELFKEGRKFGARITVAHQDRRDLLPEIRSATLTASTIASFQTTPNDATEIAPLLLDTTIKLRPAHIYPDVLNRLRLHQQQEVQDFFRKFVLPLQLESRDRERRHLLEILKDLLYQAVKTEAINQKLFTDYVERMYPLLKLTFTTPEQKRGQIQAKLRRHESSIAKLAAFLVNDFAFRSYLVAYHSYYSVYSWSLRGPLWSDQPFVSEEVLLRDTQFWDYVLHEGSDPERERFQTVIEQLERYTSKNDALRQRDTVEKIIAMEREQRVEKPRDSLRGIWTKIATIHELKSKYATSEAVRVFHARIHRACLEVPDEQKGDPIYLHPVGSSAGNISARTQVDELLIQPLSFARENCKEIVAWFVDTTGYPLGRGDPRMEEALQARETVRSIWLEIVGALSRRQQILESLGDDTAVLKEYYSELAKYPALQKHWYEVSGGDPNADVWDMVRKEAQRNAYLSDQLNTVEKLIQLRKDELQQKIVLLFEERDAYRATLPPLEKRIQQEVDEIEQQRAAFRTYVRRIIRCLIDEPGPLGEERTLRESDIQNMLLNLPKRQALVRVGGNLEEEPKKHRLRTFDLPQAAKRDEVERRLREIRIQTYETYCQTGREEGRELGHEDQPSHSWYEE